MLERKIDKLIEVHFEKSKSALLLTGARQTGKTFAIRNYVQKKKLNLIEVNFLEAPSGILSTKLSLLPSKVTGLMWLAATATPFVELRVHVTSSALVISILV